MCIRTAAYRPELLRILVFTRRQINWLDWVTIIRRVIRQLTAILSMGTGLNINTLMGPHCRPSSCTSIILVTTSRKYTLQAKEEVTGIAHHSNQYHMQFHHMAHHTMVEHP
jgi:hypothetical protein